MNDLLNSILGTIIGIAVYMLLFEIRDRYTAYIEIRAEKRKQLEALLKKQ